MMKYGMEGVVLISFFSFFSTAPLGFIEVGFICEMVL